MRPVSRWLDRVAGAGITVTALVLSLRTWHYRSSSLDLPWQAVVALGVVGALAGLWFAWSAPGGPLHAGWRAAGRAVGVLAWISFGIRATQWIDAGPQGWPVAVPGAGRWLASREEALRFQVRLLGALTEDAVRARGGPVSPADLAPDPAWPLDPSVRVALLPGAGGGMRIVAGWAGDALQCSVDWLGAEAVTDAPGHPAIACAPGSVPLVPLPPAQLRRDTALRPPLPPVEQWPQHRRDAERGARGASTDTAEHWWRAAVPGPMRAPAGIVGDRVFVGAHRTGVLEAHDRRTGALIWRAREPNWIHQDAVSDGAIVAVGFGDNGGSLRGRSPGGVAVHDAATGARLWTAFADGAVMTAPVLSDGLVLSATSGGELAARDRLTGEIRWRRRLGGWSVMGSPLLVAGRLFVPGDRNALDVYALPRGEPLWSRRFEDLDFLGHITPSAAAGTVIVSAVADARPDAMTAAGGHLAALRGALFGHREGGLAGDHVLIALDAGTGAERWRVRFPGTMAHEGHMSGSPVVTAGGLAVVLPLAQRLVMLDPATGQQRWEASLPATTRGPPAVAGEALFVTLADGSLGVYGVADGTRRCRYQLPEGFDRSGGSLAGGNLLVGGVQGGVYSIGVRTLLACADPPVPWMQRLP